jgi:tetratricopeptide (TPR) repeat protein
LRAKIMAPRSPSVREILGLIYYRLGRWQEALRELLAYKRLSGKRSQDHLIADCERALGKPERALDFLDKLKASEVGEETLIEGLVVAAGALQDLGRPGDAADLLTKAAGPPRIVREYHLRLWYALADALENAGRRPEARPWWDAIYAEDPEFFDVAERRLSGRRSSARQGRRSASGSSADSPPGSPGETKGR